MWSEQWGEYRRWGLNGGGGGGGGEESIAQQIVEGLADHYKDFGSATY